MDMLSNPPFLPQKKQPNKNVELPKVNYNGY
jgi:hypothetical protein